VPAVAADAAYWLRGGDTNSGGVLRGSLDGHVDEVAQAPASSPGSAGSGVGARLAVDANAVYWSYEGTQGGPPRVYRVAR